MRYPTLLVILTRLGENIGGIASGTRGCPRLLTNLGFGLVTLLR